MRRTEKKRGRKDKTRRRGKRDQNIEERKREADSISNEGYTSMMSPHAGTVGLRKRLAI